MAIHIQATVSTPALCGVVSPLKAITEAEMAEWVGTRRYKGTLCDACEEVYHRMAVEEADPPRLRRYRMVRIVKQHLSVWAADDQQAHQIAKVADYPVEHEEEGETEILSWTVLA